MNYKTGLVIGAIILIIGVVGYIELQKLGARADARENFINSLDAPEGQQQSLIQNALQKYAANHSLFSFSITSAETEDQRCKVLKQIEKEENGQGASNMPRTMKVQQYMAKVGCK